MRDLNTQRAATARCGSDPQDSNWLADAFEPDIAQSKHVDQDAHPLTALQGRWLVVKGVPAFTQIFDWRGSYAPIMQGQVLFAPNRRFDFASETRASEACVTALLFGECDENGDPLDIIGWQPRTNAIGTLLGRASMLGAGNIPLPRLSPLTAHLTPLQWLQSNRRGIVVIDPARARWELESVTIAAADISHARALRAALELPAPRIVVSVSNMRAAA